MLEDINWGIGFLFLLWNKLPSAIPPVPVKIIIIIILKSIIKELHVKPNDSKDIKNINLVCM